MPWTVEREMLGCRLPRVVSTHSTQREADAAAEVQRAKFSHLPTIGFDVRYRATRTPLVEWPTEASVSDHP